jgi:hypothetical protein
LALGIVLTYIAACVPVDTQQRYLVPMLPIVSAFAVVPVGALAVRIARGRISARAQSGAIVAR